MKCIDDWPTTTAKYRELFSEFPQVRQTRPGRNFMTPDILGCVKIGQTGVEVSTGWFVNERLFGATVLFGPGESAMHESLESIITTFEEATA